MYRLYTCAVTSYTRNQYEYNIVWEKWLARVWFLWPEFPAEMYSFIGTWS